jgi:kynurenine formamidase
VGRHYNKQLAPPCVGATTEMEVQRSPSSSTDGQENHAYAMSSRSGGLEIPPCNGNYTISEFPSHPTFPYNSVKDHHSDPAREAVHPQHVSDVLHALLLLRSFGLTERTYILSGHSCGACLAFQSILQPSSCYGLKDVVDAPCPAAILGLNGLYDLPALVDGLGSSHEHLRGDYETLLSNAFGMDKNKWAVASPARFNPTVVSKRVREGKAPQLILLDQSMDDQLVPFNQLEMFEADLRKSEGLSVIRGDRCSGKHAVPWEQGVMV